MWFLVKQWLVYVLGTFGGFFAELDKMLVFWTFASIGFASALFLILSMAVGEISELLGDLFGSFDHDFDHDHDAGHFDGHDAGDMPAPSVFSFKILLAFFSAFGLTGAAATYAGVSVFPASLYGVLAGMVGAGLNYAFVRFLASQQASVNITAEDYLGKEAEVIVEIPAGGIGQVLIQTHGSSLSKLSSSLNGERIPEHSLVKIERVVGDRVLVTKLL